MRAAFAVVVLALVVSLGGCGSTEPPSLSSMPERAPASAKTASSIAPAASLSCHSQFAKDLEAITFAPPVEALVMAQGKTVPFTLPAYVKAEAAAPGTQKFTLSGGARSLTKPNIVFWVPTQGAVYMWIGKGATSADLQKLLASVKGRDLRLVAATGTKSTDGEPSKWLSATLNKLKSAEGAAYWSTVKQSFAAPAGTCLAATSALESLTPNIASFAAARPALAKAAQECECKFGLDDLSMLLADVYGGGQPIGWSEANSLREPQCAAWLKSAESLDNLPTALHRGCVAKTAPKAKAANSTAPKAKTTASVASKGVAPTKTTATGTSASKGNAPSSQAGQ